MFIWENKKFVNVGVKMNLFGDDIFKENYF